MGDNQYNVYFTFLAYLFTCKNNIIKITVDKSGNVFINNTRTK